MKLIIVAGLITMTVCLSCKKNTVSTPAPVYFITATLNGVDCVFDTFPRAFLNSAGGALDITGFEKAAVSADPAFSPDIQKTMANYIDLELGYDTTPNVGTYPANALLGENWSALSYGKYLNTRYYQVNYQLYNYDNYWDSASSLATVTYVDDSTIRGSFQGRMFLANDSSQQILVRNGKFNLKLFH